MYKLVTFWKQNNPRKDSKSYKVYNFMRFLHYLKTVVRVK